jgi:uncharacterized protein YecE (DUF72 family)
MLMTNASILSPGNLPAAASLTRRGRARNPRAGQADVRIGTSGWHYADWAEAFYPATTRDSARLAYYATRFSTTEINASFYRVPTEKAVEGWYEQTPEGFLFAWKASRFVTHTKRLLDVKDSVAFIVGRMEALRDKFGPVLWQLPPSLKHDRERLARFIGVLPLKYRHVIEFRDPSWYATDIFDLLSDHNIALCISDHAAAPAPWEVTAAHVYIRMHGPSGHYVGSYSAAALSALAQRIRHWRRESRDVFCFFDNDIKAAAPRDAAILLARLGRETVTIPAAL